MAVRRSVYPEMGAHAVTQAATHESVPRRPAAPGRLRWLLAAGVLTVSLGLVLGALCLPPRRYPCFGVYGTVVLSYLCLQVILAHLEHRRQAAHERRRHGAPVTVVLPSLNEEPGILRASVCSVVGQSYDGPIKLVVVDDGSAPEYSVQTALRHVSVPAGRDLKVLVLGSNRGKRQAHHAAFEVAQGEYIATVDSDTVLHAEAINTLVDEMAEPSVGAVTGAARVANRTNLLARLIDLRYWCAFHQERASQSYLGVTLCLSGVLSIYRRDLIEAPKDRYVSQEFGGKPCTFGDDRHLTNLVLWSGFATRTAGDALCWTQCPRRVGQWVRQQLRWSKSFYREALWSLKSIHRRDWYFAYSLVLGGALPLFLLYGFIYAGWHIAGGEWVTVIRYTTLVFAMGLLRSAYGLGRTGDLPFLLFSLYGFLHLVCVVPVRVAALFTLTSTGWGTR